MVSSDLHSVCVKTHTGVQPFLGGRVDQALLTATGTPSLQMRSVRDCFPASNVSTQFLPSLISWDRLMDQTAPLTKKAWRHLLVL